MAVNKTVKCPDCGERIPLEPREDNPWRLIAYHNCGGKGLRGVYETDAPEYPPPDLASRLEPGEPPAPKKRSK
jgi:hypothetical protein